MAIIPFFASAPSINRWLPFKITSSIPETKIDLLIEIAVYGRVTLDYLILRQSLAAVQVKENIRMMREALNVFEQSLWVCPDSQQDVFYRGQARNALLKNCPHPRTDRHWMRSNAHSCYPLLYKLINFTLEKSNWLFKKSIIILDNLCNSIKYSW